MNKYKTFLVEDNRTEELMFNFALSGMASIEVRYFSNGQDLVDALPENPDMIIVDLILPDISGLEVIKEAKKMSNPPLMIVISAEDSIGIISQAQSEGIFNYVVKSTSSLRYLKQVIEHAIIVLEHTRAHAAHQ